MTDDIWASRVAFAAAKRRGSPGILTAEQTADLRRLLAEGHTGAYIISQTGVSHRTLAELEGKVGKHGKTYRAYQGMIRRCYNEKVWDYKYYGGKGVAVSARWLASYDNFLADMGEVPGKDLTLDRIDGTKDYGPTNCRWATRLDQSRNRPQYNVLNDRRAAMIHCLRENGFSVDDIAEAFAVEKGRVWNVLGGKSWSDDNN